HSLGELLAQHLPHLNAADRTALRPALDALATLGRHAVSLTVGNDDRGRIWVAGTEREVSSTPVQTAARYRAIVTALRRPNILRIARQGQFTILAQSRPLPVRGLPTGAFGVVLPGV